MVYSVHQRFHGALLVTNLYLSILCQSNETRYLCITNAKCKEVTHQGICLLNNLPEDNRKIRDIKEL